MPRVHSRKTRLDEAVGKRGTNKVSVVIISPVQAGTDNGNGQTARRWAALLKPHHAVRVCTHWPDALAATDDLALALHARRSARSIARWAEHHADWRQRRLAVVLTGTDLYKDLPAQEASTLHSLDLANRLVVLQHLALDALPDTHRNKARVILQSCSARKPLSKTQRHLNVVAVGHLREEKMPQTLMQAARLLKDEPGIRIQHLGQALDTSLGEQALQTMRDCPNYRWAGARTHAQARSAIQQAHVLVHPSRLEGGAHVLMEALRSGTPVLASNMPGNLGMLGADWPGLFGVGDAQALASHLRAALNDLRSGTPAGSGLHTLLQHTRSRANHFTPERERTALLNLIEDMAHGNG